MCCDNEVSTGDLFTTSVDVLTYPVALLLSGLGPFFSLCLALPGSSNLLCVDAISYLRGNNLQEVPEAVKYHQCLKG